MSIRYVEGNGLTAVEIYSDKPLMDHEVGEDDGRKILLPKYLIK